MINHHHKQEAKTLVKVETDQQQPEKNSKTNLR